MADWKVVALPPELRQAWLETRSGMQWTQPGLTSYLYQTMNQDGGDSVFWFTPDITTLAFDGRRIWANPDYLFALPLRRRIFAGFHEVMHGIMRHCEQLHWHIRGNHPVVWKHHSMPFDKKRCMYAMDYVVNATLVESDVGELDERWLYDPAIATSRSSWQEAYYKLWQQDQASQPQQQPQQQPGGQGPPPPPGQGAAPPPPPPPGNTPGSNDPDLEGPQDYHAEPGTSQGKAPDDAGVAVSDAEQRVALKAALVAAEMAGKMPGALARLFGEAIEPKVPWQDHLQGMLARGMGGGGYNTRKADRRFVMRRIYTPARSGKGCNTIVVVGDCSGSIYRVPQLIDRIFSETRGVLEQAKPRQIVLIWCDAKIQRIDMIGDPADLEVTWRQGTTGGGGTKFTPPFKWVDENLDNVDALVYFTDGESSFYPDKAPDYPVVWGHIGKPAHKYPWGARVDIPTDGTA